MNTNNNMKNRIFLKWFIFIFYRFLSWSWRIKVVEHPNMTELRKVHKPMVLAHWHGDELSILHLVKSLKLATMTSTSNDGSLIDFVILKFGGQTSRGSTTRGAVSALKALIRLGRLGHPISMAVDGPKGPIYQIKPGAFELSKVLNCPVFPVGVVATSKYIFEKAWNKTFLPLPFSKVVIVFGNPLDPVQKEEDTHSAELSEKLKAELIAAKQQASKIIAG